MNQMLDELTRQRLVLDGIDELIHRERVLAWECHVLFVLLIVGLCAVAYLMGSMRRVKDEINQIKYGNKRTDRTRDPGRDQVDAG